MLYECRMKSKARPSKMYWKMKSTWSIVPLKHPAFPCSLSSVQTMILIDAKRIICSSSMQQRINPAKKVISNFLVMLLYCLDRQAVWSSSTCTMKRIIKVIAMVLLTMLWAIQDTLNLMKSGLDPLLDLMLCSRLGELNLLENEGVWNLLWLVNYDYCLIVYIYF